MASPALFERPFRSDRGRHEDGRVGPLEVSRATRRRNQRCGTTQRRLPAMVNLGMLLATRAELPQIEDAQHW